MAFSMNAYRLYVKVCNAPVCPWGPTEPVNPVAPGGPGNAPPGGPVEPCGPGGPAQTHTHGIFQSAYVLHYPMIYFSKLSSASLILNDAVRGGAVEKNKRQPGALALPRMGWNFFIILMFNVKNMLIAYLDTFTNKCCQTCSQNFKEI